MYVYTFFRSCGIGRTTTEVGSKSEFECICAPGYTLSTSLSGCEACGLNYFKPTTGPAGCDRCPDGTITYRTDSTSESACVCEIGSVLVDGTCVKLARINVWKINDFPFRSRCSTFLASIRLNLAAADRKHYYVKEISIQVIRSK